MIFKVEFYENCVFAQICGDVFLFVLRSSFVYHSINRKWRINKSVNIVEKNKFETYRCVALKNVKYSFNESKFYAFPQQFYALINEMQNRHRLLNNESKNSKSLLLSAHKDRYVNILIASCETSLN